MHNVGHIAIVVDVDVEAVLPEVLGDHHAGLDDARLLGQVLFAEELRWSAIALHLETWGSSYRLAGFGVVQLLPHELVLPLLVLVLRQHGAVDERHGGGSGGVVLVVRLNRGFVGESSEGEDADDGEEDDDQECVGRRSTHYIAQAGCFRGQATGLVGWLPRPMMQWHDAVADGRRVMTSPHVESATLYLRPSRTRREIRDNATLQLFFIGYHYQRQETWICRVGLGICASSDLTPDCWDEVNLSVRVVSSG